MASFRTVRIRFSFFARVEGDPSLRRSAEKSLPAGRLSSRVTMALRKLALDAEKRPRASTCSTCVTLSDFVPGHEFVHPRFAWLCKWGAFLQANKYATYGFESLLGATYQESAVLGMWHGFGSRPCSTELLQAVVELQTTLSICCLSSSDMNGIIAF